MSVKSKTVDDANINQNIDSNFNLSDRFIPQKTKETVKIEGSTDEVVEELMDVLKNKIKVI